MKFINKIHLALTANRQLPTTYRRLLTADCLSQTAYCQLFAIIFFLTIFTSTSCKKDEGSNNVAQTYVDFTIYINEPAYIALNGVGGWIYVPAGTKGIIIYRRSQTEFTALERNCTFDPAAACAQVEVLSGISAIDSCCTSRFSIYDGAVLNGPATQPLYQYRTSFDGVALRVYN